MRIPLTSIEITRTAADPPSRPPLGELGFSGLQAWAGLVSEDYNSKLSGDLYLDVCDKMLRSDSQVAAVEAIINLPIRAASMSVEPAGDGATDQEAAELVERNLFSGMTSSWDDFVREAFISTMIGYTIHEKVFEERDGYVMLRKLPPRHPRTVEKWLFDESGGLAGIRQQGTDTGGDSRALDIPIERLIVFTWNRYWGNPEGLGLCRRMYKHWFQKDFFYKVLAIGLERFWMGIPKGRLPMGYTDQDKTDFLNMIKRARGGETAGFVLPPEWDVEMLEGMARSGSDIIMAAIEHHDVLMARAALAHMMNLGTTKSGSRALSEDQSDTFMLAENAAATWFSEHINRYVIPYLCAYNWPGLEEFPKLVIADVESVMNRGAIADALMKLTQGNLVTPDDDVEQRVRELYGLPDLPEDGRPDTPDDDDDDPSGGPSEDPSDDDSQAASEAIHVGRASRPSSALDSLNREPTHYERGVPLADIRARLDAGEEALDGDMRELVTQQVDAVSRQLRPLISKAASGGTRDRARLMHKLGALSVPKLPRYTQLLTEHMQAAIGAGLAAAEQLPGVKPDDALKRRLRADTQRQATTLTEKHAADLLFAIRTQVVRDLDGGLSADDIVFNLQQAARKRASLSFGESLNAANDDIAQRLAALIEGS